MNIIKKVSVIAGLAALAACGAQEANKSGGGEAGKAAEAGSENAGETHSGTGTVDSISGNEVTISHDEIKSIGWPAMTMAFTANDAALLNGIKAGDQVSFAFTKSGSATTLTSISKQ